MIFVFLLLVDKYHSLIQIFILFKVASERVVGRARTIDYLLNNQQRILVAVKARKWIIS